MSEQLSFAMLPQLGYRPEHFMVHAGLQDAVTRARLAFDSPNFRILVIEAPTRTGKTHLGVFLADLASKCGRPVMLLGAEDCAAWLSRPAPEGIAKRQVCILDDADRYLEQLTPGKSGPFVSCFEALRWSEGTLVLLMQKRESLPCDEHITSRLNLAEWIALGDPRREELREIVLRMALQRGIKLSEKKLEYVEKRIAPALPAVEGYLEKVVHLSTVLGRKVGFELLGDAL